MPAGNGKGDRIILLSPLGIKKIFYKEDGMTLTAIEKRNDLFIEEMEDVDLLSADSDFWAGVAAGAAVGLLVVAICC